MVELAYDRVQWRTVVFAVLNVQALLLSCSLVRYISSLHIFIVDVQVIG
jgi:hypothetical protein